MLTCTVGESSYTEATPKQHLEMAAPFCIARRCRETDPELVIENYKTACDKPLITLVLVYFQYCRKVKLTSLCAVDLRGKLFYRSTGWKGWQNPPLCT